ncbi:MAG: alpha-L-fucosidase [Tannerella sp.]|jgi:alpha-L-fucosidase|nr:alpha-L-fucosidase [Tannerella sp.]
MKKKLCTIGMLLSMLYLITACSGSGKSSVENSTQSKEELRKEFLKLQFGMFIHFNMATFHEVEFSEREDPMTFNPTKLDIGQWADAAQSAGMKYAVLTTKHHYGFCLWDSKVTDYDIAATPLAGRDIVKEFCDEFRARGIEPYLYIPISDRTLGILDTLTIRDKELIKTQLHELLTGYGKIGALIFDGWGNSEVVWTHSDYDEIVGYVKSLQPDILVTDHYQVQRARAKDTIYGKFQKDPDGKEFITLEEAYQVNDFLNFEEPLGEWAWAPEGNTFASQQETTIQSLWFWKESFPTEELMSADEIVNGHINVLKERSCNLLLNCAPNKDGLLDDNVVKRLAEVGLLYKNGK